MLKLENITLNLPEKENLLRDVSLSVKPGKLTVITGPNGGGKTSLAKIIAGLYVRMCRILEKVGLCARDYMNREMDSHLSGGEMKRIEIATVLARGAKYIVFDEPEAGIDLWSFTSLIQAFESLKEDDDVALLIISHQERILNIADEIVVIRDGVVSESGTKDRVFPALMKNNTDNYCPKGKEMF